MPNKLTKNRKLKLSLPRKRRILSRMFKLNKNSSKSWIKFKKSMRKWDTREMCLCTWMYNATLSLQLRIKSWTSFTFTLAFTCYFPIRLTFMVASRKSSSPPSLSTKRFQRKFGSLTSSHQPFHVSQSSSKLISNTWRLILVRLKAEWLSRSKTRKMSITSQA